MPVARNMSQKSRSGHPAGEEILSPAISSFIMTHNIGIGLVAFAGGIFLGIGPLWAMLENGLMLGIFAQEMAGPGRCWCSGRSSCPTASSAATAIFVMGGAGFVIAGALLAPGRRSRLDALVERGRVAVLLALGGGAMLVVAGLIEGFITPPEFIPPWAKLAFAGLTLVAEVLYFGLAGRGTRPGVLKDLLRYDETDAAAPAL